MNLVLRNVALATVLSLSLASAANANSLNPTSIERSQPSDSTPVTIAQTEKTAYTLSPKSEMILEMISQYMEMKKMGQMAMKSTDPEVRKMGQAMVKSSETELLKLVRMMREAFLANPDR
jgi:hypothetical protein